MTNFCPFYCNICHAFFFFINRQLKCTWIYCWRSGWYYCLVFTFDKNDEWINEWNLSSVAEQKLKIDADSYSAGTLSFMNSDPWVNQFKVWRVYKYLGRLVDGYGMSKTVNSQALCLRMHMWDSLTFKPVLVVLCHINRHNINRQTRYCLTFFLSNWIDNSFLSSCFITSTKLDLRFSLALCDKEKEFRQTRRERVMLGIKKLLDMEKPCFLPSSPEEVGTSCVNIPMSH